MSLQHLYESKTQVTLYRYIGLSFTFFTLRQDFANVSYVCKQAPSVKFFLGINSSLIEPYDRSVVYVFF